MNLKKSIWFIIVILIIDQISKIYIKTHFKLYESVEVFSWFQILFIENEGMAWGAKIPGDYGKIILTVFRLFAIVGIGWWLWDSTRKKAPKILLIAISFKKKIKEIAFNENCPIKKSIEKRMDIILNHDPPKEHRELITFKKRLIKYRNYIFTFLYHLDVPPDNNASERAIRNIKVKQKISGQFRSEQGCDNFAKLRSVTGSCLKNQQPVLSTLNIFANLRID
jgi:hypothetical protein